MELSHFHDEPVPISVKLCEPSIKSLLLSGPPISLAFFSGSVFSNPCCFHFLGVVCDWLRIYFCLAFLLTIDISLMEASLQSEESSRDSSMGAKRALRTLQRRLPLVLFSNQAASVREFEKFIDGREESLRNLLIGAKRPSRTLQRRELRKIHR
jgi:hypothetical protein